MPRSARRAKKSTAPAGDDAFQHSSRHADLESLIAEHMLDPERAEATADWLPSRRGNSPTGSDHKPHKEQKA